MKEGIFLLKVKIENGKIYSHIRKKWLVATPEELVRQEYLCVLVNEYGYKLEQMDEELEITGHRGSGHARADFIIWRSIDDKKNNKSPLIVVECKSDNVTIKSTDYWQGDSYARLTNSKFFITHNSNETKYWRVIHENMPKSIEEIENIPHVEASDIEIQELISKLKVFKENEFADLLHQCHNVIRNREKKDPAAAFDEIAKILFIKVWVERKLKERRSRKNIFSVEFLDEQLADNPIDNLFEQTKTYYRHAAIFGENEKINLRYETGKEIVKLLEKYNLSDTSEDIKGIAFERFLGRTFRGEIGQFFTPRTIVEFMVRFIDPKEGELICDPASGSGGFLIRVFERLKENILESVDREYQEYKKEIEESNNDEQESAKLLLSKYKKLKESVDKTKTNSRMWKLSNQYIYGCDANERMAKTSKMNMIMHGDGHGGVYHNDGFLDFGGIFNERFDIILTNPPFGATVEPTDLISDEHISISDELEETFENKYGEKYKESRARLNAALGKPISSLFELPSTEESKIKTEILFIERCLGLLKPGGRMGIVLPEGIFNNQSTLKVREFCEDRAYITAIVSLPQETFYSSGADVKCSLLFLKKFNIEEKENYDNLKALCIQEIEDKYSEEKIALEDILNTERYKQSDFLEKGKKYSKEEKARATEKAKVENVKLKIEKDNAKIRLKEITQLIVSESRMLLKERYEYFIFFYDAEKVGITATGEADKNELYPNDNLPEDIEYTAIELYEEYKKDITQFIIEED